MPCRRVTMASRAGKTSTPLEGQSIFIRNIFSTRVCNVVRQRCSQGGLPSIPISGTQHSLTSKATATSEIHLRLQQALLPNKPLTSSELSTSQMLPSAAADIVLEKPSRYNICGSKEHKDFNCRKEKSSFCGINNHTEEDCVRSGCASLRMLSAHRVQPVTRYGGNRSISGYTLKEPITMISVSLSHLLQPELQTESDHL